MPKGNARIPHAAAVLTYFLALGGAECSKKIVEVRIAAIVPVKLAVLAQFEAGGAQKRQVAVVWKEYVQR